MKVQIIRAQSPDDWFHDFEAAVIDFKRLATTAPVGFDAKKRAEIVDA